jgi:NAD(P)-dependent dehydrogenase (short-subunit alcohol dehydrogenase family)/acyl carrier protein
VRLDAWEASPESDRAAQEPAKAPSRMSVPLTGANYRQPYTPKAPRPVRRAEAAPAVVSERTPPTDNAGPLFALQKMQAEAARLHQLFLENQLSFQQQIQQLSMGRPVVEQPHVSFTPPQYAAPIVVPSPQAIATAAAVVAPALPAPDSPLDTGSIVLSVVSTLTGYPQETLSLSMDLEADLGIDSIKRVEILSTLSKQIPSAPAVNPEKLGALRTLQDIVNFVGVKPAEGALSPIAPAKAGAVGDASAVVIAVVSELTGYPQETLSLSMDLEADLGIDSIKRVEILSTLSKKISGAPNVNPEKLGSLRTLGDIVRFVGGQSNGLHSGATKTASTATANGAPGPLTRSIVLEVVSTLTGYPLDTLEGHMDLEADLGIDSIKRVEILSTLSKKIAGAPNVNPEKLGSLRTLDNVIAFVGGETNGIHGTATTASAKTVATNPPAGVAPERVDCLTVVPTALSMAAATASLQGHYLIAGQHNAFAKHVKEALQERGATASLVSESSIDGPLAGLLFLADDASAQSNQTQRLLTSALALARSHAARLNSPHNQVFAVARGDGAFGLLEANLTNPVARGLGGLVKSLRHEWPSVKCRSVDIAQSIDDAAAAQLLVAELMAEGPSEVGYTAAGRIGLQLAVDAVQHGTTELKPGDVLVVTGGARGVTAHCVEALAQRQSLKLLLLGRTPLSDEPEFLRAATDEATIKQLLLSHATGTRPTPKILGAQCRAVVAGREVRATLRRLAERGIEARYQAVDVRDESSLAAVLTHAREDMGPIAGLVHGAGVLRDRRIEDKSDDDFEQVVGTKIGGLLPLLRVTANDRLKLIALFTSVSGRFGRKGQTDYAVANEALVGLALNESARRPGSRVVALDFGPWNGGMVTEALKREFAKEGAALIDQQLGAEAFCEAVLRCNRAVELVLAAGMRKNAEPLRSQLMAVHALNSRWPILSDHQLAQKPVLPLALTLEWFAQAAQQLPPSGARIALEDVHVLRGLNIESTAVASVWNDADNTLELRNGLGQVCVRAKLRFEAASNVEPQALERLPSFATALQTVYREQLFHGPQLEAISAIEGISETGMRVALKGSPFVAELVPDQLVPFLADPLVIDGVFQALIVWCRNQKGAPSLPQRIKRLRVFRPFSGGEFTASIRIVEQDGATVTANVEVLNASKVLVAQLEGYVCTVSPTLELAFERSTTASLPPTRAAS